jgi:hypothetical protein
MKALELFWTKMVDSRKDDIQTNQRLKSLFSLA